MDRAIVVDNRDPASRDRLRVQIPTKTGKKSTDWIWPVVTSGFTVLPKPGDQVWVLYEGNDSNYPVWLGKTSTTTSYRNQAKRDLKDVSRILERVVTLEEKVKALEDRIDALSITKADVGHSH